MTSIIKETDSKPPWLEPVNQQQLLINQLQQQIQQQQSQILQFQNQHHQSQLQKLNFEIQKLQIEQYNPLVLLGAVLNLTGLTFADLNGLLLGVWYPKNNSQYIRAVILDDAKVNETFLKRVSDLQIKFEPLVSCYNEFYKVQYTLENYIQSMNDPFFPINYLNFSLKMNYKIRKLLITKICSEKELSKNQIAQLFNIAPSTVSKIVGTGKTNKNK